MIKVLFQQKIIKQKAYFVFLKIEETKQYSSGYPGIKCDRYMSRCTEKIVKAVFN